MDRQQAIRHASHTSIKCERTKNTANPKCWQQLYEQHNNNGQCHLGIVKGYWTSRASSVSRTVRDSQWLDAFDARMHITTWWEIMFSRPTIMFDKFTFSDYFTQFIFHCNAWGEDNRVYDSFLFSALSLSLLIIYTFSSACFILSKGWLGTDIFQQNIK